jgi:putative membrane protein
MRIKRGDVQGHRRLMTTAMWTSAAFLAAYVVNHALHGVHGCGATGAARVFYFVVLDTHTPLAIVVAYLAPRTAWLGSKGRVEEHKRLAKWTFPIWLYVSVTGVAVYVMAYHLWPPAASP